MNEQVVADFVRGSGRKIGDDEVRRVSDALVRALPAAVLIFVLALFIKEVPLRGRVAPPEAGEAASQQPELVS